MIYEIWKAKYLFLLKNKIKSHENSIDYTLPELNKLTDELLEKGGFQEDMGHFEDRSPIDAATESYNTWFEDYF